jgi:tetrahydromethanopterin S-methyltransferase subunit B
MNQYEFVLGIIIVVMVAGIFKARYKYSVRQQGDPREAQRLHEEIRTLKERIQVLERIATDKSSSLEREIDQLRDR